MAERRSRSFGPTVLAGLGGAALAAVAGAQRWATATGDAAGVDVSAAAKGSTTAPLVVALALVALAAWGVVLVVRGRVRQVVSVLGGLASAGALTAALVAFGRARDDAVEALVARGGTGDAVSSSLTGWFYAALVGALVALVAFGVAVVASPGWPAMGSRYDAPAPRSTQDAGTTASEQDLWRAMDDGRDPTADERAAGP